MSRHLLLGALWLLAGCVPAGGGGGGGGGDEDGAPPADAAADGQADAQVTDAQSDACQPACGERVCGADGCGGECGACPDDLLCSAVGECVAPSADCGDGACAADEDCATCADDCGSCCGNGACEAGLGEDCAACAEDCGSCCGDGVCGPDEDCDVCAADCGCGAGEVCTAGRCESEGGEGSPRIVAMRANGPRLGEGEELTFSALVTDPDGVDDILGGLLESPEGLSYGAFVGDGQPGSFGLTLSWADVHRIEPIEFVDRAERRFVAVFFDQAGNSAREPLDIELWCGGQGACAGVCTDLEVDPDRCGACDRVCAEGAACEAGVCACPANTLRCANERCVPAAAACDRVDDCGDGSDEAGCCFDDAGCGVGAICVENGCVPGCREDVGCADGEICRGGGCVPGCDGPDDCRPDEYCAVDRSCRPGCQGDEACPEGQICDEQRACVEGCRPGDCGPTAFSQDVFASIEDGLAWLDDQGFFADPAQCGNAGRGAGLCALVLLEKPSGPGADALAVGYAGAEPADRARIDAVMDYMIGWGPLALYSYREGPALMALSVYLRTGGPRQEDARAALDLIFDRVAVNQGPHGYWCYSNGGCFDASTTQFVASGLAAARAIYSDPEDGDPGRLRRLVEMLDLTRQAYAVNAFDGGLGGDQGHGYRVGIPPSYQQTAAGLGVMLTAGAALDDATLQGYLRWLYYRYRYQDLSDLDGGWENSVHYHLWASARSFRLLEAPGGDLPGGLLHPRDLGTLPPAEAPVFNARQQHLDPAAVRRIARFGDDGPGYYADPREPARWYFDYAHRLMSAQDDAGRFVPPDPPWDPSMAQIYALLVLERSVGGACVDADLDGACDARAAD